MPNEADVGSRTLTLESDFDLMIGDPLPQTLNPNSQLLVAPHASPDADKPYPRSITAVNWRTPKEISGLSQLQRIGKSQDTRNKTNPNYHQQS